jgi:hypothetical protein
MAKARSEDFKTPTCRLAFGNGLFKMRAAAEGGAKRYGCTLIFPDKDRPFLEKIIAGVIVAEWGDKGLARAKVGGIRSPILKGDGKEARSKQSGELHKGFGPGLIFIRPMANEDRPPVVRATETGVHTPATSEICYSGCYGFAWLNAFAWSHPQNGDGVSFGIRYFQKTKEGEVIGGVAPVNVEEYFEGEVDNAELTDARGDGGAGGLFG